MDYPKRLSKNLPRLLQAFREYEEPPSRNTVTMDFQKCLPKKLPRFLQAFREHEGPPSHEVKGITDGLEKILQTWKMMEAMFKDEERGENILNISGEVKLQWLRELRDLAWEMDGLVDIYDYKLVEIQLKEAEKYKGMKKKRKAGDASTTPTSSPIADASFQREIVEHMRMINEQYARYMKNKALMQEFHYGKEVPSGKREISECREPTGHLLVDSHQFLGRKEELSRLKEMLNCAADDVSGHTFEVIAVVGMGGVGKTTLAQHAYKAAKEDGDKFSFDKMGWVFTSEDLGFDVLRLTKDVIESFGAASSSSYQLSVHQDNLMSIIKGKRFMLVVDDLWEIHSWQKFLAPFVHGGSSKGSRILVTTRSQNVAEVVLETNCNLRIDLKNLQESDGWSLLKEIVFGGGDHQTVAEDYEDLMAIGKRIAQKCGGLPLAIKITGNLLRRVGKSDKEKWMQIRDNGLWDQHLVDNTDEKRMILGSLYLSYAHLPPDLRMCFKSLSVLPKGGKITREELINMWMSYGVIDYSSADDVLEINADKMIDDLVSWAFLIKRVSFSKLAGWKTTFEMHDLIHDLAVEVSGEELKAQKFASEYSPDSKTRNLSLKLSSRQGLVRATRVRTFSAGSTYWNHPKVLKISDAESLRSLCLDGFEEIHWNQDCIAKMKHLHVLELRPWIRNTITPEWIFHQYNLHSLCISQVKKIPDAISNLKNLRFLKLEYISNVCIPEAVYTLINLRVLIILETVRRSRVHEWSSPVWEVSESISSLVNLQELQIKSCSLEELPRGVTELTQLRLMSLLPYGAFLPIGISKLTKLRQLSHFTLCDCEPTQRRLMTSARNSDICFHAGLEELAKMNKLNGELCISNLCYAKTEDGQAAAILPIMKNLHMLDLHWEYIKDDFFSIRRNEIWNSMEVFVPYNKIRSLFINDFPDNSLQSWMGGDPSLNGLVKIRLSYFPMCCTLSSLGHLPRLKSLKIEGDIHFDIADNQTEGCSTCSGDQNLKSFFPQLQILSVWFCPGLQVIPLYKFKKLSDIYVCGCRNFNEIECDGGLSSGSVTPDGESSPPIHLTIAECDGPRPTPEMQKRIEVWRCRDRIDLLEHEHSLSGEMYIPSHPDTYLEDQCDNLGMIPSHLDPDDEFPLCGD